MKKLVLSVFVSLLALFCFEDRSEANSLSHMVAPVEEYCSCFCQMTGDPLIDPEFAPYLSIVDPSEGVKPDLHYDYTSIKDEKSCAAKNDRRCQGYANLDTQSDDEGKQWYSARGKLVECEIVATGAIDTHSEAPTNIGNSESIDGFLEY